MASDTTAPIAPTQITATSLSLVTLSAQWSGAQDPDSGIGYYVYGIGTTPTGTYNTLANVKWWQVVNAANVSINMDLDPTQTYYVSVYAVNGAGISSPIVTSNAVHPSWLTLGKSSNVMQLAFAPTGFDTSGNPTTGWTPAQITTITAEENQKPQCAAKPG